MSSGALKEHHPESLHFLLLFLFPLCLPIMSISSTSFNTTTMAITTIIIATTVACFLRGKIGTGAPVKWTHADYSIQYASRDSVPGLLIHRIL